MVLSDPLKQHARRFVWGLAGLSTSPWQFLAIFYCLWFSLSMMLLVILTSILVAYMFTVVCTSLLCTCRWPSIRTKPKVSEGYSADRCDWPCPEPLSAKVPAQRSLTSCCSEPRSERRFFQHLETSARLGDERNEELLLPLLVVLFPLVPKQQDGEDY